MHEHEHEHETQARIDEVLGVPSTVNERRAMDEFEAQVRMDEVYDVSLYSVTSTVAEYRGHKDVVFNWFVLRRQVPVFPFTEEEEEVGRGFRLPERLAGVLVDLPDAYTSEDYWYPEDALNQMFALDEAEKLVEYLRTLPYGDEPTIHEEELPIGCGRMGPSSYSTSGPQGHYMLEETPGYPLSFEVWGYYDLRRAEGPCSDEAERYAIPAPYVGEGNELLNTLDGERQEIAHTLGTEHPLFKLVDGALRSADIDELRVARAAAAGWPSDGWEGDWEFPGDVCEVDGEETPC
jgi:hypothetical protein